MSNNVDVQKATVKIADLDWPAVESAIKLGNVKLTQFAQSLGVPAADLKKALVEHFGNNIEFKRGRKGGIVWRNS